MSKTLYLNRNTAIINFNQGFPGQTVSIINSESYKTLLTAFINQTSRHARRRIEAYTGEDVVNELIEFTRQLHVYNLEDIKHPLSNNLELVERLIEEIYEYWRNYQRCSVLHLGKKSPSQTVNFIAKDTEFNGRILAFYRSLQEKVQGRKNKIYRQLKAGTNASVSVIEKASQIPSQYDSFKNILFVDSVLLHSPLILHPKTNKREGHFQETFENPIENLWLSKDDFYCYPAKVGSLLAFVYFHKDFIFSGLSLANLFELATTEEIAERKPDIMVVFGHKEDSDEMVFHYDKENEMVVSKVAYQEKIEYFGYMKKMILTSFNVAMMHRSYLPIHGAMVNIYLENKEKYGVVFMGDSGAGKSEIIEEIGNLGDDKIDHIDVIFDDMGVFMNHDGTIVAQGSEVGAFVRLDDLDRGLPYQAMDRSIFMNPESSNNARVIIPISTHLTVSSDHTIDYFFYANNYDDKIGVNFFDDLDEAKATFVEGKRMAKATTHEVGITKSYFANPFGPLQKQEMCDVLIDEYFTTLQQNGVKLGEVYTNLGVEGRNEQSLKDSAQAVLDLLTK
ncbi:phosphoenolpyruvate carboxykinase (ATP) [Erysipelothrix urinaevulpis]|uniref:phosphoenolpyruvate carboxykinase (ATP) n=1 Tax=Erysipelothrix urinaevulpis TaxID=2683717 RepID=UPI00135A1443|nr:phosphoenolpyruvate carboxykinase (ATP) [Erysipelothrix urinaevulpis]